MEQVAKIIITNVDNVDGTKIEKFGNINKRNSYG